MVEKRPGKVFVLQGPAGVGKNTIMHEVLQRLPQLRQMPTATTRPPRPGEKEGREHYFVSLDKFRDMLAKHDLIEYQEVYPGLFYGTPRQQLEAALNRADKLIADIEVVGGGELKKAFPDSIVLIFIEPPSLEALETRLRKRGNVSEQELAERLKRGEWEMTFRDKCDYVVINDDLKRAVDEVIEIIAKELHAAENV